MFSYDVLERGNGRMMSRKPDEMQCREVQSFHFLRDRENKYLCWD
jgi:hypothetical protein